MSSCLVCRINPEVDPEFLMMVIVEFHPVSKGVFDTLNQVAMLASNMWKQALAMFLYDKK
jgi:hypothetical protein